MFADRGVRKCQPVSVAQPIGGSEGVP
jgi:hypothetical protein